MTFHPRKITKHLLIVYGNIVRKALLECLTSVSYLLAHCDALYISCGKIIPSLCVHSHRFSKKQKILIWKYQTHLGFNTIMYYYSK